jgi:hypothetical protein
MSLNLPSYTYSIIFATILIGGLILYYSKFNVLKISGISIIPMIAFWFNTRSFQNYLVWFPLLTVVMIVTETNIKNKIKEFNIN